MEAEDWKMGDGILHGQDLLNAIGGLSSRIQRFLQLQGTLRSRISLFDLLKEWMSSTTISSQINLVEVN